MKIFNQPSLEFLEQFFASHKAVTGEVLFWLDAHGYGFDWQLREEIAMITTRLDKAFILIDDLLVPEKDCFGYDEYNGQICSYDYIKNSLNNSREYTLYYPNYTDRTSRNHPLRGWGLIEYGHNCEPALPEDLKHRIKKQK